MSDLKKVTVGIENFQELIQQNKYYVDKTSFIKTISDENVALFTRPRRFGKTLTMSMLKYFFEMNYDNPCDIGAIEELFKDLDISKDAEFCKKYMGQYPVIFLSLKDIAGSNFEEAMTIFCGKLYGLWNNFKSIILSAQNLDEEIIDELKVAKDMCYQISLGNIAPNFNLQLKSLYKYLKLFSEAFYNIFKKKTIIIIDEYDVPLEKSRGKYYSKMVEFVKSLFSVTFKTNDFLEKGFLTGCLRVSRESIFTGLNNIPVYDCTKTEYSELFGFTNKDVAQMLDYYSLSDKFDTIKEWYDGYEIGKSEIYNPYSVNTYVKELLVNIDAQPDCAWLNSSSNDFLLEFVNYLPNDETDEFKKLLDGQKISKKLNTALNYGDLEKHDTADLWTMLYSTGYLTKSGTPTTRSEFILRIPNEEVKLCFEQKITSFFEDSPSFLNRGKDLLINLMNGSERKVVDILNEILPKFLSLRDVSKNHEDVYHSFLIGLLSGVASKHIKVKSQKERGDGYPDIVIEVNSPSNEGDVIIILELKRATSTQDSELEKQCNNAISQCHDKNYYRDYIKDRSVKNIYLFGLAFCNRTSRAIFEDVSDKIKVKNKIG